jgi:hypothetical protein
LVKDSIEDLEVSVEFYRKLSQAYLHLLEEAGIEVVAIHEDAPPEY